MDGTCKGTAAAGGDKPNSDDMQNQSPNPPSPPPAGPAAAGGDAAASAAAVAAGGRRPFTSLSQEEADLALARVLQEQEHAYMMLTGQGGGAGYVVFDGYEYYDDEHGEEEEEEDGSEYEEEEQEEGEAIDEDEEGEAGLDMDDPARYDDDDDVAGRLSMALAGIGDWRAMEEGDDGEDDGEEEEDDQQDDVWEDVDPDEYSYEELIALGEVVGTESKGLPADTIASLPSVTYQAQDKQDGNMEQCVICRVEFEEGESLVALPCKHAYHSECINHWLQLNKVCPMCSAEVPSTADTKASSEVSTSVNNKKA